METSRRELSEDVPFGIGNIGTLFACLGCRSIELGKPPRGGVLYILIVVHGMYNVFGSMVTHAVHTRCCRMAQYNNITYFEVHTKSESDIIFLLLLLLLTSAELVTTPMQVMTVNTPCQLPMSSAPRGTGRRICVSSLKASERHST